MLIRSLNNHVSYADLIKCYEYFLTFCALVITPDEILVKPTLLTTFAAKDPHKRMFLSEIDD